MWSLAPWYRALWEALVTKWIEAHPFADDPFDLSDWLAGLEEDVETWEPNQLNEVHNVRST